MIIEFLTVQELHDECEALIVNGHGDYKVNVWTGGYYDGYACDTSVDDNDATLCVSTGA